jgi:hypothetical protein
MRARGIIGLILSLGLCLAMAPAVRGADAPDQLATEIGRTPPRLSFTDGQVSFWRPGAQDWVQAQINSLPGPRATWNSRSEAEPSCVDGRPPRSDS